MFVTLTYMNGLTMYLLAGDKGLVVPQEMRDMQCLWLGACNVSGDKGYVVCQMIRDT